MDAKHFQFVRLSPPDLPQMRRWLAAPHIRPWFGDPQEWLEEIAANWESDWIVQYRADLAGVPAGFAQWYQTERAPDGPWRNQPPGTRGIDFFLGESALLGRGLGAALVRDFVGFIDGNWGQGRLVTDPAPDNLASVRVAERCGFALEADSGLYVRPAARG